MRLSVVAAGLLVLVGTAAQAEIICTQHRGCRETGGKVYRNGGVVTPGSTVMTYRDGVPKAIKVRRIYYSNQ
jgi:hypothetical protein